MQNDLAKQRQLQNEMSKLPFVESNICDAIEKENKFKFKGKHNTSYHSLSEPFFAEVNPGYKRNIICRTKQSE